MKTITFKASDDEARMIRSRARKENLSISEYLRQQALHSTIPKQKLKTILCPVTGVRIFSLPHSEPLTTETVKEMLSDFP